MKFACVARHRGEFKVRLMCRVLGVSPTGYYAWRKRGPSARAIADERLLLNIRVAFRHSDARYGAPRIHRDLRDHGQRVGPKRVARLMRQDGLVARRPTAWTRTTDSRHDYPVAPNVLARRFDVNGIHVVNRVWVADITYIPTHQGFLYLAVVLDLASRRVVGWAMGASLEAELALAALRRAIRERRPEPGLLHHSDRGVQYACGAYQTLLAEHGIEASMSRTGNCWDNAVAESFFATLEVECLSRQAWATHAEAERAIIRYIAAWYNTQRRHSTLGYRSPAGYEREVLNAAA